MKFSSEQPEELSRRAQCDDESRRNNGTTSSPGKSKESHGNLFLGSTAIMFLQQYPTEQGCTWKKIRQRLVWDNGTKVLMHRKHEKFRRHQTDSSPRYIQTRSRECTSREVWAGSMVRGLDTQDTLRLAVTTKPVNRNTCGDRMRAELENSEEGREHLAREQARVDAKRQTQAPASSHKRPMSEEWDRLPGKALRRVDGEDATMRHDITATSGVSSSSASGGPALDIDSQPSRKRAADVQTEDLEDGEQTALTEVDANESTLSLPQAEGESSD